MTSATVTPELAVERQAGIFRAIPVPFQHVKAPETGSVTRSEGRAPGLVFRLQIDPRRLTPAVEPSDPIFGTNLADALRIIREWRARFGEER